MQVKISLILLKDLIVEKMKKVPKFLKWIFSSKTEKVAESRLEHEIKETIKEVKDAS